MAWGSRGGIERDPSLVAQRKWATTGARYMPVGLQYWMASTPGLCGLCGLIPEFVLRTKITPYLVFQRNLTVVPYLHVWSG
jgi:hypothetical protein